MFDFNFEAGLLRGESLLILWTPIYKLDGSPTDVPNCVVGLSIKITPLQHTESILIPHSMSRLSLSLSLVVCFSLVRFIEAQCVTDGYVPCYPAGGSGSGGSGGLPLDDVTFPAEYDTLNSAIDTDLAKRGLAPRLLFSRQNALCCSPTDRCLVLTNGDIPFCYVSILYFPSFFLLLFHAFFSLSHHCLR